MRPDWNEYFMVLAKIVSSRSTCNSRPTGCVITHNNQILSTGYNGAVSREKHCIDMPYFKGSPYCYRRILGKDEKEKKDYCIGNHAERNAIAHAAKKGISLNHSTLYVTLSPCYDCIKILFSSGIENVYYELPYQSTNHARDKFWIDQGLKLFKKFEQLEISKDLLNRLNVKEPTSIRNLTELNSNGVYEFIHK